jgi:hypothetical protein
MKSLVAASGCVPKKLQKDNPRSLYTLQNNLNAKNKVDFALSDNVIVKY